MNILQFTQIIAIVVVWLIYIYGLFKVIRGRSANKWNIVLGFTFATLLIVYLTLKAYTIAPADFVQIMLTFGLVLATIQYAISAAKQADVSVKMAKEMKKQRYDTVRPVIDIYRDPTDEDKMSEAFAAIKGDASQGLSCALHNVGLGPAIDLYSFVQTSSGSQSYDCGTLAVGEKTSRMKLSMINEINKDHPSDLLLAALYRDVYDRDFISSREVSVDKERKGAWSIGPLKIVLVKESKPQ